MAVLSNKSLSYVQINVCLNYLLSVIVARLKTQQERRSSNSVSSKLGGKITGWDWCCDMKTSVSPCADFLALFRPLLLWGLLGFSSFPQNVILTSPQPEDLNFRKNIWGLEQEVVCKKNVITGSEMFSWEEVLSVSCSYTTFVSELNWCLTLSHYLIFTLRLNLQNKNKL